MATGASVSANLEMGLMMTSHMLMMVGGARGDATCVGPARVSSNHIVSRQRSSMR